MSISLGLLIPSSMITGCELQGLARGLCSCWQCCWMGSRCGKSKTYFGKAFGMICFLCHCHFNGCYYFLWFFNFTGPWLCDDFCSWYFTKVMIECFPNLIQLALLPLTHHNGSIVVMVLEIMQAIWSFMVGWNRFNSCYKSRAPQSGTFAFASCLKITPCASSLWFNLMLFVAFEPISGCITSSAGQSAHYPWKRTAARFPWLLQIDWTNKRKVTSESK